MSATDIVGYVYMADIVCPTCIIKFFGDPDTSHEVSSERFLDGAATLLNIDRYDEYSFDSDYFPKVIFEDQVEDGDTCSVCGGKF